MEYILRSVRHARPYGWLFAANLFLGFHYYTIHYVNSSFLGEFLTQSEVGFVFALASLLGIAALVAAPRLLARLGAGALGMNAALLNMVACVGLALGAGVLHGSALSALFVLHAMLVPVSLYTLDILLERQTKEESTTGNVRGMFLSVATLAALLSPLLAGHIAGDEARLAWVYGASAAFLVPFVLVLALRFTHASEGDTLAPRSIALRATLKAIWRDGNVFHIAVAQFLMRFFFSWMVIYMPVYLTTVVGFSWPEVGTIFFVMLLPYLIIEWPAGVIADKWLGEKELLALGFVVAGFATLAVAHLTTPSIVLWSAVLFLTRVGTALIESMSETYFFKHVDGGDAGIVSAFRMLQPLAYTVGPLIATALLVVVPIGTLWTVLGLVLLLGLFHTYMIVDTK